ncbi:MAG: aspartate carbamoyltransferase [Bacteroidota bacterium]|nr:aspartate carbamoyltransferase [Bacteroidota bacterium]
MSSTTKLSKNSSLVSIWDYSVDDILQIMEYADYFEHNNRYDLISDKVVASLFFEPSTRTRLSFETAIQRLGGRVIGFTDASSSSVKKGETLKDTILTVANYSDLIVMRHPLEGSTRFASEISAVPVINAGDGANQHPTQTLLDLYSIIKTQGKLENLQIVLVGDLKYGRTIHSLIHALSDFNPVFHFVSHKILGTPKEYKMFLDNKGIKYYEHSTIGEIISEADILYMTRVQKERFSDLIEYEKTKDEYRLTKEMLTNVKSNMKIMHPLPRVNEIAVEVDDTEQAYYFQQAKNGVYTRQAIITKVLGLKI